MIIIRENVYECNKFVVVFFLYKFLLSFVLLLLNRSNAWVFLLTNFLQLTVIEWFFILFSFREWGVLSFFLLRVFFFFLKFFLLFLLFLSWYDRRINEQIAFFFLLSQGILFLMDYLWIIDLEEKWRRKELFILKNIINSSLFLCLERERE